MKSIIRTAFFSLLLMCGSAASLASQDEASPIIVAEVKPSAKICRKVEVTGSLVKKGYVCKTRAQWREIIDSGNRVARSFLETGQICSSGAC